MNEPTVTSSGPASRQYLPVLLILFVGSGAAALVYEVVWFQLLELVIGSSAVSLGVLLGTFMGGMCLGSWLLPRYISVRHHPMRVYAVLELCIGAFALLLIFGMPLVSTVYLAIAGGHVAVRAIVAGLCLLPPTIMMGATLPAMARWVKTTPQGVSWMGYFYGGNIAGAVVGSLVAGFYLLRVYDQFVATYAAVAIDVLVACVGLLVASRTDYRPSGVESETKPVSAAPGSRPVYLVIALSGLTALSAQVVWTRILSLMFGATVYTFSLIVGVFLFGLGIGSSLGAALARSRANSRFMLGACQMGIAFSLAWAAYMLSYSLPFWPINPSLAPSPIFNFQLDIARCLWVVLPGSLLWGASFPLALASVAEDGQDPGRLVGGVYAANTIGAIAGALGTALIMVVVFDSEFTQKVLIFVAAVSSLIMLAPIAARTLSVRAGPGKRFAGAGALAALTLGAGLVAWGVPPVSDLLIAYGRYSVTWIGYSDIIYTGEGRNAFVAVSQMPNGVRNYHNAGKVQASSEPQDMRLQRMLGHITHLIPKHPSNALVIGCGAGVTAGAVSIGPNVEHVTIAEIEPLVPKTVSTYFSDYNYDVVNNPKVTVKIDDARHFLLTTDEKFDAITSDPLDPWVKGAATLYTREFFDLVKQHLNPGGVVTLFVQLYESTNEATKSEIGTFLEAFPNGVIWGNTLDGKGYDLVMMGQVEDTVIDLDEIDARLASPEYAQVAQSLREIGIYSAVDLFSTYAGSADDLAPWLSDAQINTDRNLRLQFLAGLGVNTYDSGPIYADMVRYARFPEGLFKGSPERMQRLRQAIANERQRSIGSE